MKQKLWPLDRRTISNILVIIIGISFYMCLSHLEVVRGRISMILNVLAPFIMGFTIAYLLNSPMCFFERTLFKKWKWKRGFSILTVYLLALVVLAILVDLVLPQVVESVQGLMRNAEFYLKNLNTLVGDLVEKFNLEGAGIEALVVSYQDLLTQGIAIVKDAVPQILNFGVAVGNGVITAVTAVISSIYMLLSKHTLISQVKKAIYAFAPKQKADIFLHGSRRANSIFVGFINGKLIDSAIIGLLCFFFTSLLNIPMAVLISVIIGVTNIIPFFGPIIGAVPCVMILIIIDPWSALKFTILVILLQQFDGNILGPKILGDSTGLSAIWVLVAIVTGGGLFGFIGMILGVPTFAVIYMLVRDWVDAKLAAKGMDGEGNALDTAIKKEDTP